MNPNRFNVILFFIVYPVSVFIKQLLPYGWVYLFVNGYIRSFAYTLWICGESFDYGYLMKYFNITKLQKIIALKGSFYGQ